MKKHPKKNKSAALKWAPTEGRITQIFEPGTLYWESETRYVIGIREATGLTRSWACRLDEDCTGLQVGQHVTFEYNHDDDFEGIYHIRVGEPPAS